MRARSLAILGVAAYAIFLVAKVPASVVAARIGDASGGAVQMSDPRGTLWNGEARATVLAPGGVLALDHVEWRFAPSALAGGHIAFDVAASGRGIEAKLMLGRGFARWIVQSADARIDAALATMLAPLLGASHPEGIVTFATPELRLKDNGEARGTLTATWTDAAVSFSETKPLGKYKVDATAEDGPLSFTVTTLTGPLRVSGRGTFAAPRQLTFSGEARGEGSDTRALDPLLDMLGPRRADGARTLEIRS
ncbi:MAG TPA: type II secretion system protein N [Usitatibacter sp.]|nr:type II secretion system protein N [Usitatibacter sp.]